MVVSNVGSIEYDARINTSQLKSDAKSVETTVANTSKSVGNSLDDSESRTSNVLGSIMGKVKAAAVATATAISAAGVASAVFGIKSAADFEQTRIGLENMLGSADKARALLSDISKFAAETPFEFPELAQATRQLVAFGFSADDAFSTMKQLGDVSAAVGTPINDLAYLMGTLRTQGRAFTIDIRQFAQRGIPIYEYLAKVLKTDEQAISRMIEAGQIGFPEVQKAFAAMTAQGGKFYKTMDKQSESLSGQFSTLKDNLGQTLRQLVGISVTGDVVQGSLFDRIRQGIAQVNRELPSMAENFQATLTGFLPTLKEWAKQTANVATQIGQYLLPKLGALFGTIKKDFLPAVANLVKAIGPTAGAGLAFAIGVSIDALNLLLTALTPVINFMRDNTWIVYGLVTAFIAFRATLAIQGLVTSFMAGMAALQGAIAVTSGVAAGATGVIGGMRLALMALTTPWQVSIVVVGTFAVIEAIKNIADELDKLLNKWGDANKKVGIGGNVSVSGNSGIGLVQQLKNAFGGFRAGGGPVSSGRSYIVGENGPELFSPATSGSITANDEMGSGSSVMVNVNMQGIMTRSKTDERDIAKSLIARINEELRAKGQPLIGGGAI